MLKNLSHIKYICLKINIQNRTIIFFNKKQCYQSNSYGILIIVYHNLLIELIVDVCVQLRISLLKSINIL